MLDAALNRAMEAARVLEDIARFVADDRSLARSFKESRHTLSTVAEELGVSTRHWHRDTEHDVGTALEGTREGSRDSMTALVDANASRLQEALRSVEECAKLDRGACVAVVERLRYDAYTHGSALHIRVGAGGARQWRVCGLLTRTACTLPWRDTLASVLEAGADAIQVREKDAPTSELVAHVREVVEIARPFRASIVVNDRLDVALAAGADGVHLGRDDMSLRDARRCARRDLVIGATAHTEAEAEAALGEGADYIGVGPMFESATKPGLARGGPRWFAEFLGRFPRAAHLAIGGITPDNVGELVAAGCRGVAVSSCVLTSREPGSVVRRLREAFA